ncbi:uncharacterized protein AB675_2563 [Cyphellophora attinorum]|uniref:Uncharacterized protein n=1 Tax=Cyphellophora attinorum TaxID=1664694 RepID=A0A0N1P1E8_9EURO|nr:uncharacterized protein AB675_2563 [Phialophora attinorum]KPI45044.1 hypothetical protein AB675_2563 [Phialophora attinorum]
MGQYWKLIAPRLRACKPLSGYKLGEFYFDASNYGPNGLVYLLATPIAQQKASEDGEHRNDEATEGSQTGQQHTDSASMPSVTVRSSPRLMGLPTEVHRRIFDELKEDIDATICLGATTRYFWSIAKEHLHVYCKARFGRWAGEPLVCVGDYAKRSDYPPGLFSDEELEIMRQKGCDVPGQDDYVEYSNPIDDDADSVDGDGYDTPNKSWEFRLQSYVKPYLACKADMSGTSLQTHMIGNCYRNIGKADISTSRIIDWDLWTMADMENFLPKSEAYILRNLTTKQFARAEAIALEPEYVHGPFIDGLGFGHVIRARICWSADPSSSMHDVTNITRGLWAGHRFDIVTLGMHDEETRASLGDAWEDVSDEVAKEVRRIFEADLGPEWRKDVEKQWKSDY